MTSLKDSAPKLSYETGWHALKVRFEMLRFNFETKYGANHASVETMSEIIKTMSEIEKHLQPDGREKPV